MNKQLEDAKEALIGIIEWYRDEYHHADWIHTESIEKIKLATTLEELEPYENMVDSWLE